MKLALVRVLIVVLISGAASSAAAAPSSVRLASDHKALQTVVVAENASERVRAAATTLAEYLKRISGAPFRVAKGDGDSGIVVGAASDFPRLANDRFDDRDPIRREDYLLQSHDDGLRVIGASDLAVEHAVWDLLYRLGYRQFFPGEHWEIVPQAANLEIAVDDFEHPNYFSRRIWYGFGAADYAKQPYQSWCARNRATSGIELNSGHSYEQILKQHRQTFAEHPEYLALVGGERRGPKFCLSNPAVRKLVIDHKLEQIAKNPDLQSVSIDPSDGGGWCECEQCRKLGSISDQAVGLGNDVAEAIQKKYGDKFVGMYAYSQHSPPPSIRVHPRLVISVATAFIKGDFTVDQLMTGWQKRGATIGVREYFSVNTWDRDLPGQARGSSRAYIRDKIPHFHEQGARFFSAESSDNWGCNGLGYYLASRILWDVQEAERVDELVDDFLTRSFGKAKPAMANFYELIDGSEKPLLSDDLLGRMYRELREARSLADESAVERRIDDLVLYTRYVELYLDYSSATGEVRQQEFERLLRHAYRMRTTMMIHTMGLYRDLPSRDKSVSIPADAVWGVPEGKNPWKSSEPFSPQEISAFIDQGIERRALLAFTPKSFSTELVSVAPLELAETPEGNFGGLSRGERQFYTWADKPTTFQLKVTAGLVYANQSPAKFDLFPSGETLGQSVAHVEVPGTREAQTIELRTEYAGLQRIALSDRGKGTRIEWPVGIPVTIPATSEFPAGFNGRWTLCFYVPKGTKTVGGYASAGAGFLLDGDGRKVHEFTRAAGYFAIPVAEGQDGRVWRFSHTAGERILMTVPPYLARTPKELLLPAEVVAADREKDD